MRMTTVAGATAAGGAGAAVEDAGTDGERDDWPIRRHTTCPDPLVWGPAGLALVVALGFLVANAAYNQGRFSPPLDDVYIHLEYARQIGLGHF